MPTYRGKPACVCLVAWYPVHEAELRRRGILAPGQQIHIFQLIGDAPASGGVHKDGGAGDDDQVSDEAVWVARQMGADAAWARVSGSFVNNKHRHLVLRGCPHNGPARYQIDAVDDGFNGLGAGGRGGRDDGPRPLSGRTWREGIQWAIEQGDDMPYTEQELRTIVREEVAKVAGELLATEQGNGNTRDNNLRRAGDTKELAKAIAKELAEEQKRLGL